MKINAAMATVILLVSFAVLMGVHTVVSTVDATTIAPEWQGVWAGLSYIFLTSAAAPLFAFIRNFYGYAENYLGAEPEKRASIKYEANKLWGTWLKYEGYIKAFAILIIALTKDTPLAPYAAYIAGSLAFIVDLIRKSLSDIAG